MKPFTHINHQPPLYAGLTSSEWGLVITCTVILALVLFVMALVLSGTIFLAVPMLVLVMIFCPIIGVHLMARLKRDRPNGWYGQALKLFIDRIGLIQINVITKATIWDVGRRVI